MCPAGSFSIFSMLSKPAETQGDYAWFSETSIPAEQREDKLVICRIAACSYGLPWTLGKGTPEKTQQLLLLWSRRWAKPRNPQQHFRPQPSPISAQSSPEMGRRPAGSVPSSLPLWPLHIQGESGGKSTNPQEILGNVSSSRAPQQEAQSAPERHSACSSIPERTG